jgi:DNA ligase (NAD+)
MNQEELKTLLQTYDDAYYNNDTSLISDYEYDALKNEYVEKYGEYDYVPGDAAKDSKKYNHTTNVSSLDKLQITDEAGIRKEIERLWPVVIQPKMDGLTLVTYPDGTHVTRGNGHIGEIVTEKANKVAGIGESIAFPIRSEVVMLHSEFDRLNKERVVQGLKPFENCRNAAAGMLRRNESDKVEGLKAFAYNMLFEEQDPDDLDEDEEPEVNASAQTQIDALKLINWNTVDSYIPKDIDDAFDYIMNYDRTVLDYDIDGLVVKHNGPKNFGETSHHPLNAIAIKFAPEGGWTTLRNIEWSVGRTGKTVPKAIFDPIYILGSEVKAATLHNFGIVKAHKLDNITLKGKSESITEVFVIKANDVIPAITKVRVKENDGHNIYVRRNYEPTKCPDCGSELRKERDQLFCDNESCSSRILNRLIHLAGRDYFNIEDLGEETAIKLITKYKDKMNKEFNIMLNAEKQLNKTERFFYEQSETGSQEIKRKLNNLHPSFIYELTLDDIKSLDGFAEKSATNLYNEIQKSKVIDFDKFLAGCGIPLVGRRAAKDIAEFYYKEGSSELAEFAKDHADDFTKLSKLKGIGPETINSLLKYYDSYLVPFGEYGFTFKNVIPKKKATNQMNIVITGEFEISRKEITAMIEEAGHKVSGSVSSKTNYLLAAPGEEGTSKFKKATEIGTKIIHTLKELEEVL